MAEVYQWNTNVLSEDQIETILYGVLEDLFVVWRRFKNIIKIVLELDNRQLLAVHLLHPLREWLDPVITEVRAYTTLNLEMEATIADPSVTDLAKWQCSIVGTHLVRMLQHVKMFGRQIVDKQLEQGGSTAQRKQALATLGQDTELMTVPMLGYNITNCLDGQVLDTDRRRRYWLLFELLIFMVRDLELLCALFINTVEEAILETS